MSDAYLWRRLPFSLRVTAVAWSFVALPLGVAHGQTADSVTIRQLQEELARRDAVIIDLVNRVRALEENHSLATVGTAQTVPGSFPSASQPSGTGAAAGNSAPENGTGLEVDEIAAERALERTLVQEGASLLRSGEVEFTPEFTFFRAHDTIPVFITTSAGTFLGARASERNIFDWNLGLDVGLPFDSQFEISVPYRLIDQQTTNSVGGIAQSESHSSGSGEGDLQVGLAKTLVSGGASQSNVIGRLIWTTGTGTENDNGVVLGEGNSALAALLNASWRRDPVVFLMSGGYSRIFDSGSVRRGDSVGLSLGAALALSPESALTFSFDQSYSGAVEIGGLKQPGTELLSSMFNMSASTILGRGIFLRVKMGIGLTSDAPDYQFGVSIPIRFDVR